MIRKLTLLSLLAGIAFQPCAAMAQKKEVSPPSVVKKETTPVDLWIAAENTMIDKLNTKGKESIFIIRNKHSIIRTIDIVERDVGAAVKACGAANPDMKDKMEGRFKQWKDAVNPITETAQKSLKEEINKQKLVSPDEFRKVLKLNDEAFKYSDERTVKKPVSSPEACEKLLESMDDTEDRMISLLQKTLLPESVIKSRAEKLKKSKTE